MSRQVNLVIIVTHVLCLSILHEETKLYVTSQQKSLALKQILLTPMQAFLLQTMPSAVVEKSMVHKGRQKLIL